MADKTTRKIFFGSERGKGKTGKRKEAQKEGLEGRIMEELRY